MGYIAWSCLALSHV